MSTYRNNREKRLRETCEATDAEMASIKSLLELKWQHPRRETIFEHDLSEILDSWLFQSNWKQANNPFTLKSLSITHIISVTDTVVIDQSRQILHIPGKDSLSVDLLKSFHATNTFLDACHKQSNGRALVHCDRGVSRSSTIILAYLMHHNKWTLLQALEYLLTKRIQASPNYNLLLQLVRYENELNKVNDEN